ncbi:hypothetical protein KSP39_PZI014370 [Platanthera zijinensis]|uniref:Uncharacterized protein n=1 Tax=Platanthera zijinensis TaxID=2320716 RepID=A0AAP0BBP4_9ASPA
MGRTASLLWISTKKGCKCPDFASERHWICKDNLAVQKKPVCLFTLRIKKTGLKGGEEPPPRPDQSWFTWAGSPASKLRIMSACARLFLELGSTIHSHPYRDRLYFHPLDSGITAAKTLNCRRRILFSCRMASGVSRASVTPVQIMTLSNGDCFEILAASGLSETGLRNAIDSTMFKQWLKNMEREKGLLAAGQMHLRRVEVQISLFLEVFLVSLWKD